MPLLRPTTINTSNTLFNCFSNRRVWRLEEDWIFMYKRENYIIKSPFLFDGASIPFYLKWWRSPTGILFTAALIHDWGYQNASLSKIDDKGNITQIAKTRNEIDIIFREISNDNIIFAYITYIVLYFFGWIAWNQYRKQPQQTQQTQ